jgi:hypothetical protein
MDSEFAAIPGRLVPETLARGPAARGGGVDTQKTLPFGMPVHNIQANTPVENILAMFKAINASARQND